MKQFSEWIKQWLIPKTDKAIECEIDTLNIKNIYYLSMTVGIVQLISLIVFLITEHSSGGNTYIEVAVSVALSIVLCLGAFLISGRILRNPDFVKDNPRSTRLFIIAFIILIIAWGMLVSIRHYIRYQQLLTFYTVELLAVLFVKLKPIVTTTVILGSYIANYLILTFGFTAGHINPYNYMMLAILSVIGALTNYRLTADYIRQKNRANLLNASLEIIANHDSITRLQNRYALNQRIPDYLNCDLCIAMGDIDSFKSVNDTYGHHTGDDVLKAFADILTEVFPMEQIYRYGGDEFLILCPDSDYNDFMKKIDEVNARFRTVLVHGKDLELGCSFGCVTAHADNSADFFHAVMEADQKLYDVKKSTKAAR
ncbi:MAG: diguanylate cyclase [Ruminococcus sp.]|nr:diguanylate cyclase [Ruminococcus sp.]